jgi:hypothetical protein
MSLMDFAIGFMAGEGYLGVSRNYQWKPYIQPRFSIQLHERDKDTLEELQKSFGGIGKVKERNTRDHVMWKVHTKEGVKKINNEMKNCNLEIWKKTDKYKNFKIWSEIVDIHCGETTTTSERIKMAELAKELNKDAGHNNVDWEEFIARLNEYEKEKA